MFISDGGSDTLIVDTDFIHGTGSEIEDNADSLQKDLDGCLNDFQYSYSALSMPLCLRNTLHAYDTSHRTELGKMVKRRHTIGELLTKAASLHAFNEEMQKRGFAGLYQNINGYYNSSLDTTDPTNMQRGIKTSN